MIPARMATGRRSPKLATVASFVSLSDAEVLALMVSPKWRNVVSSVNNGHKASRALAYRAQQFFEQGAPVVDPKTKRHVRLNGKKLEDCTAEFEYQKYRAEQENDALVVKLEKFMVEQKAEDAAADAQAKAAQQAQVVKALVTAEIKKSAVPDDTDCLCTNTVVSLMRDEQGRPFESLEERLPATLREFYDEVQRQFRVLGNQLTLDGNAAGVRRVKESAIGMLPTNTATLDDPLKRIDAVRLRQALNGLCKITGETSGILRTMYRDADGRATYTTVQEIIIIETPETARRENNQQSFTNVIFGENQ